jgi:hypothetical protein
MCKSSSSVTLNLRYCFIWPLLSFTAVISNHCTVLYHTLAVNPFIPSRLPLCLSPSDSYPCASTPPTPPPLLRPLRLLPLLHPLTPLLRHHSQHTVHCHTTLKKGRSNMKILRLGGGGGVEYGCINLTVKFV